MKIHDLLQQVILKKIWKISIDEEDRYNRAR